MGSPFLDTPLSGSPGNVGVVPAPRLGASQDVAFNGSGGSAVQSTAFSSCAQMIQLTWAGSAVPTAAVRIAIGANPTATASSTLLPIAGGGGGIYYRVYPGWKLSALSNDANTGSLNITECAVVGG